MSITKLNPRRIHLAGPMVLIDEYVCSEAITPGMLIELFNDSGTLKWRKNSSATELCPVAVALDRIEMNDGIDDAYAAGDVVKAAYLGTGAVFYGLIPSGQDISPAELLQSNADGKLKSATATTQDAALGRFQSLDNPGSVTADTRLRVQVIQ